MMNKQMIYIMGSDRPILIFFITDTNYLHVYVPDNRYAEPIFIYCYKVIEWSKSIPYFGFSSFQSS